MSMRRFLLSGFAGLPVVLSLAAAGMSSHLLAAARPQDAAATSESAVNWRTDYGQASAEAIRAGKPLFVVFRCER